MSIGRSCSGLRREACLPPRSTLLGGLGHLGLSNMDAGLLVALLCGSIPGILIGARLAGVAPEWLLRPILALTLCYAAYTLFNKG